MSLELILNDGRKHTVATGTCLSCDCEFSYPDHIDYYPRYCPYCGVKFEGCTYELDTRKPFDFKDKPDEAS